MWLYHMSLHLLCIVDLIFFPNVCALEEVVSFGVEVLFADWAGQLFSCFTYVLAQASSTPVA